MAGWSCSGGLRAGRRGAGGRPGRRTWRRSPGIEARRGMPTGCILYRQQSPAHQQPSAEHPGLGPGAAHRLGAGIPDLNTTERIVAERAPLHGDRGGRGVPPPSGRAGLSPCQQVTVRRRAARSAVGATLRRERRSPPTEQRFPPVERPPVNTAARARKGHDQRNAEPREARRTSCWLSMPTSRGASTPGHCRDYVRETDLLHHDGKVQREEQAFKEARRGVAGACR
jgi:hypothetical protein